jgi:hypothetical protein
MNQPTVGYLFFFAMSIHQSTSWYNTSERNSVKSEREERKAFWLGI